MPKTLQILLISFAFFLFTSCSNRTISTPAGDLQKVNGEITPKHIAKPASGSKANQMTINQTQIFDGDIALDHVKKQVSFGPRIPGSEAHQQTIHWITSQLMANGWQVDLQETTLMGHPIKNIIGRKSLSEPDIILGAHYDSRLVADKDPEPDNRLNPVPGANDGASGVATLIELARIIPDDISTNTWLVFFDAEDNGDIPGWDWILGSRAFVEQLDHKPDAAVIIDMVGDADLQIFLERNSDPMLSQSIWNQAAEFGYEDVFVPISKHAILDDHSPFLNIGVPAVLIIDIEYPYWHTTSDTSDKVSAESMQVVGNVLLAWLTQMR
jgi:glutaminyl-peptide cyclotransferase